MNKKEKIKMNKIYEQPKFNFLFFEGDVLVGSPTEDGGTPDPYSEILRG